MNKTSILIIGKTPPPVGGVSVHMERLLYNLRRDQIPFESMSLSFPGLKRFIPVYLRSRIIHLNISSVYLRALLTMTSLIMNKKHINTFHGSLGNKSRIKNLFDKMSVYLSAYPVVLNEEAEKFALRYNKKTIKISAFIPPLYEEKLSKEITEKIEALRKKYKTIYCTNAYGLMYDDKGHEIYGISDLVKIFRDFSDKALILSEPGGSYKKYFHKNNIPVTDNILMITEMHSFVEILKLSDTFIRSTSTDGDSLSVKEALYLKKNVIAANCVQRPPGVILYEANNPADLYKKIIEPGGDSSFPGYPIINGYRDLKKIYEALLNDREIVLEKVQEGKA